MLLMNKLSSKTQAKKRLRSFRISSVSSIMRVSNWWTNVILSSHSCKTKSTKDFLINCHKQISVSYCQLWFLHGEVSVEVGYIIC